MHILQILTPIVLKYKMFCTRLLYLRYKTWYFPSWGLPFFVCHTFCSTLNYTPLDDNEQKTSFTNVNFHSDRVLYNFSPFFLLLYQKKLSHGCPPFLVKMLLTSYGSFCIFHALENKSEQYLLAFFIIHYWHIQCHKWFLPGQGAYYSTLKKLFPQWQLIYLYVQIAIIDILEVLNGKNI